MSANIDPGNSTSQCSAKNANTLPAGINSRQVSHTSSPTLSPPHSPCIRSSLARTSTREARTEIFSNLLEERLWERVGWLTTWECELGAVSAWHWDPDQISVFLFHPGRSAIRANHPRLQFRMTLPVSGDDPGDEAERLAARLTAEDLREIAEVCGGSKEFADQLGYPWPGPRRRA